MDRRATAQTTTVCRAPAHGAAPRTLIVDDEPLARRGLEIRLARAPDIEIVGQYGDGDAPSRGLREHAPGPDVPRRADAGHRRLRDAARISRRAQCRWSCSSPPTTTTRSARSRLQRDRLPAQAGRRCAPAPGAGPRAPAAPRARGQRPLRAPAGPARRTVSGKPPLDAGRSAQAATRSSNCARDDKLAVRDGGRTVRVDLRQHPLDRCGRRLHVHPHRHRDATSCAPPCASWRSSSTRNASRASTVRPSSTLDRVVEMRPHTNGEGFLRWTAARS